MKKNIRCKKILNLYYLTDNQFGKFILFSVYRGAFVVVVVCSIGLCVVGPGLF